MKHIVISVFILIVAICWVCLFMFFANKPETKKPYIICPAIPYGSTGDCLTVVKSTPDTLILDAVYNDKYEIKAVRRK